MANTAQSAESRDHEARSAAPAVHGRAPILYVLTGDDTLLLELGPLLGTRYRTRPIDTAEQISPVNVTPWALMIDASARNDARAQAARVRQQYPLAPLLVICADGTSADWTSPLARGALTAVIERGALGSDAFEAALSCADLQMAVDNAAGATDGTAPRKPAGRLPAWLILSAALLLAALALWYGLADRSSSRTALVKPPRSSPPPIVPPAARAPAAAAAPVAAAPRTVLELLSDARVAFREGKSLLPPTDGAPNGNSALELYAKVLAQDPQNEEAQDGLRRLFVVASARIRADLNAGKDEEAGRLLADFRGVGIDPAAIAALESDIAAGRPRALAVQARTAITKGDSQFATQLIAQLGAVGGDRKVLGELHEALESQRNAARLAELASHARALIKSGALLEPAGDSAQSAVLSMQQLNRGSSLTLNTEHELQAALIERTVATSRAGQFEAAQQLLNSAAILGNSPELASARAQLQAQLEATHVRTAAPTVTPPPVTAAAPVADFVRAKPSAPLDVAYPQRAFDAGQQGYVIVEFTLDAKGHASDPKVVESNPARVFNDAALQAVKHGRFDASELGDSGAPLRARIRIAFKPVKQPAE